MNLAVLALGFLCGATATLDMDFHWHLALGQGLVARGFPQAEPFSHLPAGVPDRQAWLADAAFAILDRIGGVAAIRIVLGAVFAAGCLSVLRLARRRTTSLALALLPLGVYLAFSMARLRVRPDLFTLALVPLFAEMLDRPPSWRRAIELLAVSAMWANLHPGSLIAGLLALTQIWPFSPLRVAYLGATAVGLCLTPDGIGGLLRFTADTAPLRALIPEWQRLWERPFSEFWPEWTVVAGVLAMSALAAAGARASRRAAATAGPGVPNLSAARVGGGGLGERVREAAPRPDPGLPVRDLLRSLVGLLLAASAVRFLFALVLPTLWAVSILDRVRVRRTQLCAAAWAVVLVTFVAFPGAHLKQVGAGLQVAGWGLLGADPPAFPLEAATYLAGSGLTGNLAHPAGWGGYLAWKLTPRFKTATDGRVTHFGPEIAREWSEGVNSPSREEIFARRDIDLIVIPRTALPSFRDDQPYTPIYGDSFASVLLCLNGPHAAENRVVLKEQLKEKLQRRVEQPR